MVRWLIGVAAINLRFLELMRVHVCFSHCRPPKAWCLIEAPVNRFNYFARIRGRRMELSIFLDQKNINTRIGSALKSN